MLVIENCNSLSDLRQKLIDGEEVRTARDVKVLTREAYADLCMRASLNDVPVMNVGDMISRQKVLDKILKFSVTEGKSVSVTGLWTEVNDLPPVTPQPKMGRWIYGEDNSGTGRDGWYCNQCGHFEFWDYSSDLKSAELNLPNLCPNCKAKMQEVEN